MRRIFSAGGIVVRSTESTKVQVMVTQHSGHHGWDFPKGHLEAGETSEDAAQREVEEETGVVAQIVEKVGKSEYFYQDEGEKAFKTVTFFLMKYVGEGVATTAEEVSEIVWLDPNEVADKLTFKGSKEVWEKARRKILSEK